jgi:hypothetical protein
MGRLVGSKRRVTLGLIRESGCGNTVGGELPA